MNEIINNAFDGATNIVNNPFRTKHIVSINMRMVPRLFGNGAFEFGATIRFKNGNTCGEQNFEGKNFPDIFNQVINFCNSIG